MHEFQQTTEVTFADVEIAVRETQTTFDEMVTKKQAIEAASQEVNYLQQRWELLPDPNESAILLIEDLLDAQERLADEERAFVLADPGQRIEPVLDEGLRRHEGIMERRHIGDRRKGGFQNKGRKFFPPIRRRRELNNDTGT